MKDYRTWWRKAGDGWWNLLGEKGACRHFNFLYDERKVTKYGESLDNPDCMVEQLFFEEEGLA